VPGRDLARYICTWQEIVEFTHCRLLPLLWLRLSSIQFTVTISYHARLCPANDQPRDLYKALSNTALLTPLSPGLLPLSSSPLLPCSPETVECRCCCPAIGDDDAPVEPAREGVGCHSSVTLPQKTSNAVGGEEGDSQHPYLCYN
jgi:hypothetical protein